MGLKEFYYKLEDKYYSFIEWLANNGLNLKPLIQGIESKGIPSLPLFTAFLLIIIGGAYLYTNPLALQGLGFGGSSTLSIRVQTASNEPVADAVVTITGTNYNESISTDAGGVAMFAAVPSGTRLRVTVSKQGYSPVTRDYTAGSALAPFIMRSSLAAGSGITLLVTDQESAPVPGAQVSYVVNGEQRNVATSSAGVAQLSVPIGTLVSVTVSGQGFDTATDSFTADSPTYQRQITLSAGLGSINNFNALAGRAGRVPSPLDDEDDTAGRTTNLATTVDVTVNVVNSTAGPVSDAVVVLFNYADHSQLAAGTTGANGIKSFNDIAAGIQAYVAVDADGFVSQTSAPKVTQQGTTYTVTMAVISNVSASNLTLNFSDDAGSVSSAFSALEFYVFNALTHQVVKRMPRSSGRNRVVSDLPAGQSVYISAFSDQHVRYSSEVFTLQAGANNTLDAGLVKKTAENSINLRVKVTDFYGDPVGRSVVTPVLAANNHVLLPGANSSTGSGEAELKNMPLQPVVITATNGSFYGETPVNVSLDSLNVTVQLIPTEGTVRLTSLNLLTNTPIDPASASYTISYGRGQQRVNLAGCPAANAEVPSATDLQNGICVLHLASGIVYTVTAKAAGYFDKSQTFWLNPNEQRDESITLIPTTSNEVLATPVHLYESTETATGLEYSDAEQNRDENTGLFLLEPGKVYTAVFEVQFKPGTTGTGVYLRLGGDTSISSGNAVIFKGFPIDDPFHINSGNFNLTASNSFAPNSCGQNVAQNQVGTFKWLDAFLPSDKYSGSSGQIKVSFLVTKSTPSRLNVSFRAYAAYGDGTYLRSPADLVLGTAKENAARSACAAETSLKEYKVISSTSDVVSCAAQACLMLHFSQAGSTGIDGFSVYPAVLRSETLPTQTLPNTLQLHYSIFDFNPDFDDGTTLKFQTDRNFLSLIRRDPDQDTPNPLERDDFQVSPSENSYTVTSKTPRKVSGVIKTNALTQARPDFAISLSYESKASLATNINLLGLPQPISELSPLPAHYVLLYNASSAGGANDNLTLKKVEGPLISDVSDIDFISDPILPADALLVVFNFSQNAPCTGRSSLSMRLSDPTGCFEQIDDPRTALQLPPEYVAYGENLMMLKYDASSDRCKLFSKNPNRVKVALNVSMLTVVSVCTQKAIEIPLNIKVNEELTENSNQAYSQAYGASCASPPCFNYASFKSSYKAVTKKEKAWEEPPVADLGVDASFVHVLYNNRQYSKDGLVTVYNEGDSENPGYYVVGDNPVNIPVQGYKPIVTRDAALPALLGPVAEQEDQLLKVYETDLLHPDINNTLAEALGIDSLFLDNQADSMDVTGNQSINVLRNTAFRRRQLCTVGRPCPFGLFPYSAFVDAKQKPLTLHLGGDAWTGKYGNGKLDFEFYGLAGSACTDREQEGIYDYYWTYTIDDVGNYIQTKNYKPLEVKQIDYSTFGCSIPSKNLCGKLSFGGGSCINNCGDGWYYAAYEGMKQPQLCDGETAFKVKNIYPATEKQNIVGKMLENAVNGITQCLIAEYAGAMAGCGIGYSVTGGNPAGAAVGSLIGRAAAGEGVKHIDAINWEFDSGGADDVPELPSFFNSWQKACGYGGTALQVYDIYSRWNTLTAGNAACREGFKRAWASCLCLDPTGPALGEFGQCALMSSLQSAVTSPTIKRNIEIASDRLEAAKVGASSRTSAPPSYGPPGTPPPASTSRSRDTTLSNIDACSGAGVALGSCSVYAQGKQDELSTLADANTWYDRLCTYPFILLGAQRLLGTALAYDVPERVHLQIINGGKKSDSFLEAPGGWVTDEDGSAVDCTSSELFPGDEKDYVWYDWDLSSLRAYKGRVRQCMDYEDVKVYLQGEDDAITETRPIPEDGQTGSATFYITSRNR